MKILTTVEIHYVGFLSLAFYVSARCQFIAARIANLTSATRFYTGFLAIVTSAFDFEKFLDEEVLEQATEFFGSLSKATMLDEG